jgi:hypothetical protein
MRSVDYARYGLLLVLVDRDVEGPCAGTLLREEIASSADAGELAEVFEDLAWVCRDKIVKEEP